MKDYKFKINGTDYSVSIDNMEIGGAEVSVNGTSFNVEFEGVDNVKSKKVINQIAPDPAARAAVIPTNVGKPATDAKSATPILSPLPGVILDIVVKVGQQVKEGDKLLVLEAMKMENNIDTFKSGTVKEIAIQRGDSVLEGDVLLTIE